MKFTVPQPALAKTIAVAQRFVATRVTLPVLSNVLLSAEADRLVVSATNLEMSITLTLPAEVDTPGSVTLPARLLGDLVNAMSPEDVTCDVKISSATATITGGRQKSTIKGVAGAEFPLLPTVADYSNTRTLPADVLKLALDRVTFAAVKEAPTSRPALTAVNVRLGDDSALCLEATDGFRLARYCLIGEVGGNGVAADAPSVLIPARVCEELARLCNGVSDLDEHVKLIFEPNRVHVIFPPNDGAYSEAAVASQLIDARFPDVSAIIPKLHAATITAPIAALRRALKPAGLFARDSNDRVELQVERGNLVQQALEVPDKLVIHAVSAETGDSNSEVPVTVEGEPPERWAMNESYLDEALARVADCETIVMELTKPDRPLVFRVPGDDGWLHVIMPMQMGR